MDAYEDDRKSLQSFPRGLMEIINCQIKLTVAKNATLRNQKEECCLPLDFEMYLDETNKLIRIN